ncbi:MAG: enolase C-terminal domain-like protein [Sediminispirochaetaceae bacterium]
MLTDISLKSAELYYLPVSTRIPLRFGTEAVEEIECLRVKVLVENRSGSRDEGWGEVPLNVQWIWPDAIEPGDRTQTMKEFAAKLSADLMAWKVEGHALDIGWLVLGDYLENARREYNASREGFPPLPSRAAVAVFSAFDIAIHDAYGKVNGVPIYAAYQGEFFNHSLSHYLASPDIDSSRFEGLYPADFFRIEPRRSLKVWHLVGGDDPLTEDDLDERSPDDGYPVLLGDWIRRDGLNCLKVKLFGGSLEEDLSRITEVGRIALGERVSWLSVDFNCTVGDPEYMVEFLDRLRRDSPQIYAMLLFVEQPFPASSVESEMNVAEASALKPLFLDEALTHWDVIPRAKRLGWSGAALKTCKTQTAAVLSGCVARMYGMALMVMDLTNPMIAALAHASLAAHTPTLMGFESNAPQYYPAVSLPEERIHPGIFRRRRGEVDVATLSGSGMGYRIPEIGRELPEPELVCGAGGHSVRTEREAAL